ncbi:MAG TPA: hypothetical protein VGC95_01475 [Chitinophagaceae bacterium]
MAEHANRHRGNDDMNRHSEKTITDIMQKFEVSQEQVNIAINIVGSDREEVEKYLEKNRHSRCYNIW